jgi:ribosomal protein S18 acetylase RimI-like enzyme
MLDHRTGRFTILTNDLLENGLNMIATIRPARLEDALGIGKVQVDSWRSSYKSLIADSFLATLSYERRAQVWSQNLSDPHSNSFLYVAESSPEELIGFVSAGPEREGDPIYKGELYAIYLLQQAQRQGLGRKLMDMVMRELVERGFSAMLLWVLKDNLPARKFYEAAGGEYVREKSVEIGRQSLIEVAYGWKNLLPFIKPKE